MLFPQFPFSSMLQRGQHKLNFLNRRSTTLKTHGAYWMWVIILLFKPSFALKGKALLYKWQDHLKVSFTNSVDPQTELFGWKRFSLVASPSIIIYRLIAQSICNSLKALLDKQSCQSLSTWTSYKTINKLFWIQIYFWKHEIQLC